MKTIFLVLLIFASTLFADKAPFAVQSDLAQDLSDSVLGGIFHHRLGFDRCIFEKGIWIEGFGSYRQRESSSQRNRYENWFGGVLGGFNYSVSSNSYLNFFAGGSCGKIDICHDSPRFDTHSILFGMTWEQLCENHFLGLAVVGGVLSQKREVSGFFGELTEEPQGVLFTPELTYAYQYDCFCAPIFSSTLRYVGFFVRDYQHRQTLGTLYVKDRTIQLITLRGELAAPLQCVQPYLGFAGRLQIDGNSVQGRLLLNDISFSDGIDDAIGYALVGLRGSKQWGCLDFQANVEGSYDTDRSWRILGEFTLNCTY